MSAAVHHNRSSSATSFSSSVGTARSAGSRSAVSAKTRRALRRSLAASSASTTRSYLLQTLNGDCYLSVFQFLTVDEIVTASKVCEVFNFVASSDFTWELVLLRDAPPRALQILWDAVLNPDVTPDAAAKRVAAAMQKLPKIAARIGLAGLGDCSGNASATTEQPPSSSDDGESSAASTAPILGAVDESGASSERDDGEAVGQLDCETPALAAPVSAHARVASSGYIEESLLAAVGAADDIITVALQRCSGRDVLGAPLSPTEGAAAAAAALTSLWDVEEALHGSRSPAASGAEVDVAEAETDIERERLRRERWSGISWRVAYYCLAIEMCAGAGPIAKLIEIASDDDPKRPRGAVGVLAAAISSNATSDIDVCSPETFRRLADELPSVARDMPVHVEAQLWRSVKSLLGATNLASWGAAPAPAGGAPSFKRTFFDSTTTATLGPESSAATLDAFVDASVADRFGASVSSVAALGAAAASTSTMPLPAAAAAAVVPPPAHPAMHLPIEDAVKLCQFAMQRCEAVKETGLWYLRAATDGTLALCSLVALSPYCLSYVFYRAVSRGATHAERILNFNWFGLAEPLSAGDDRVAAVLRTSHISFLWQDAGVAAAQSISPLSALASVSSGCFGALTAPATPALFLSRLMQIQCRIAPASERLGGLRRLGQNLLEAAISDAAGLWVALLVSPFLAKRLESTFVAVCTTVVPAITSYIAVKRIARVVRRRIALWSPSMRHNVFCLTMDTVVPLTALTLAVATHRYGWTPLSLMRVLGRFTITILGVSLSQKGFIDQEQRADETALLAHVCGALTVSVVRAAVRVLPYWSSPLNELDLESRAADLGRSLSSCATWQQRNALLQRFTDARRETKKRFAMLVLFEELTVWAGACAVFIKEGSLATAIGWKVGVSCGLTMVSFVAAVAQRRSGYFL